MEKSATYKLIIIGGSAGSLQVIFRMLAALPVGFRVPVILVLHRYPNDTSTLADVLQSKTHLPVKEIEDKDSIVRGTVYVCPADYHVLFENDETFSLDYSEKVHHSRPSIDVAFSSAADVYGSSLIAVLLSGANADGAAGLQDIRSHAGMTIVQDPVDAEVGFMPQQALILGQATYVVKGEEIAMLLKNYSH